MRSEPQKPFDRAAAMWAKVDASGDCWLFVGARSEGGYGHFWNGRRVMPAHRWVWEHLVGPIADGLELDHLCRVRACVNPDHLEPVTPLENTRRSFGNNRKTHCPQGHPYDGDNLAIEPRADGGRARRCQTCGRRTSAAWRAKRAALR
jgi:hypothetical protein